MATLFLIFSHTFTETQRKDALDSLGVDRIVDLPDKLKSLWSHVPPDLTEIKNHLQPLQTWS